MINLFNKKTLFFIFFLAIGFLSIFFSSSNIALAADKCSWTKADASYNSGLTTLSCPATKPEKSTNDSNCSGSKPLLSLCCCDKDTTPATTATTEKTEALFTMPDFQVKIPGLTTHLPTITCTTGQECSIPWIGQYIAGIYNYAMAIAGILAALVLMAGGLMWLISAGDASKITQAKELMVGSISGLIILVSSYVLLIQINPDLVNLGSIKITSLEKIDIEFAESRLGGTAEKYKAQACATNEELTNGVDFYATGYFKYPYKDVQDVRYLCMMSMQGTCPNGLGENDTCIINGKPLFSGYPHYPACQKFSEAQYNAKYFAASDLIVGQTIAGPDCPNLPNKKNTKVCFKGKTYTITDSGGGIKGKRIDILSASESEANANSGVGKLTIGACK